jgi:uncharacterized repeat protein (TIGR01451 family)
MKKKINKTLSIFSASAVILNTTMITSLLFAFPSVALATDQQQVTICHYQSSESNPYNEIHTSINSINGHFENNGTPKSGHEDDLLLPADAQCPISNPQPTDSCGADIALVLDSSGSIDSTNLDTMKSSFKGFVDSMLPTTPTQFSVTDFDTTATVVSAFSDNVSTVKTAIDVPTSGGGTNWEDALVKSFGTFDPRAGVPNLIIFASDGEPTFNNGPDGGNTGWLTDGGDLSRAITQANLIKTAGTRIITLGIGSNVSQANLQAISSANAYFNAANFSELTTTLQNITTELCGGTITVNKIIDADGNLETTKDQTPGIGWEFNIDEEIVTTGANGQTVPLEVDNGSYNVGETAMTGYEFIDAACTGSSEYNGSLDGDIIYSVEVDSNDVINCTFYNHPLPGTLTVIKQVNNTYGGTAAAADFTIEVTNGSPASFPGSVTGQPVVIPADSSYSVSETAGPQGYAATYIGDCSGTMPKAGQKTCTVVNDQLDPHADDGIITVIKNVVNDNGGTAEISAFTLYVNDTTVTSGASTYFATGDYTVSEDSLPGYAKTGIICRDGEEVISRTGDFTLSAGQAITCTITNDDIQPKLTVTKIVSGGDASISNFPLSVTLGQNEPVAVTSGQSNGFDAGDYVVSEISQVSNYTASWSENCPNGAISLAVGDDKTCTITNTYNIVPTYSVHGIKWNDRNGDSEWDCTELSCEEKLGGWTIFIDEDADKQLDEGEQSSVTASSGEDLGWYWFSGLPAGNYRICEVQQSGWTQTYPGEASCHYVTLPNDSQQSVNSVVGPQYDFGNHQDEVLQCTGSGTYTVNADFDKGSLINVNHTPSDQIQLSDQINAFNFIWVAVSTKGTVVKINTDTGAIVGEYKTSPSSQGSGDPSRTTVDKDGSVWLSNRANVFDGVGSVIHIGLVENNQCEDRNGNGTIETSVAQNDIKPWSDASGTRNVATAEDECIVHYVKLANSSGTRHISVNADNDIWVAGLYTRNFDLIKGGKWNVPNSGTIIRSESSVGYGGYGGLIDKNGVIWSARNLLRWDTALPLTGSNGTNWTGYNHDSYGLCIDGQGNVWDTQLSGDKIRKFSPAGIEIGIFSHGFSNAQGCAVDKNDNVWVAHSILGGGNSVGHILNDGTFIGNVAVGSGPTGVSVDAKGKIWATNYYDGTVSRIDPTAGPIGADSVTPVGATDLTTVGLGGNPYNYSDMTGSTLSGKAQSGTWTVVHDGTVAGYPWRDVSWTASLNGGSLSVTVATSSDGVTFGAPQTITSGQSLASLSSRYLKIVVSFDRSDGGDSPVLYDLSVNRDCGETPPPPPVCTTNCGGGGGGTIIPYETPTPSVPAVLGETLKPVLLLTKTVAQSKIYAGAKNIEFTLTVTNTGNASGLELKIKDTLPAGLTYSGGTDTTRTWEIPELKAGETRTFTYKADSATDLKADTYVNTADLTASNYPDLTAQASVNVNTPQVLGEKLVETGFSLGEFLILVALLLATFGASQTLRTKYDEKS